MKTRKAARGIYSVVDPELPWLLPSLYRGFPKYRCKMSPAEWKRLLARAKQGDPEAEERVAEIYDDGCNDRHRRVLVRVSRRKAYEWYRCAAEHGRTRAQNNLGIILGGNCGVKKDVREALLWLKRSFREGNDSCSSNNIAMTYRENGNLRQALSWLRKAAKLGDDSVLIQLGVHCYWGKGVRTDPQAAVRYFRRAVCGKYLSEIDRDDANFYLAIAYLEGKGVKESPRLGRKHLELANRDNDHLAAQRLLRQLSGSSGRP